jgi:hypothetical protein
MEVVLQRAAIVGYDVISPVAHMLHTPTGAEYDDLRVH